jgi:hypothetical protein
MSWPFHAAVLLGRYLRGAASTDGAVVASRDVFSALPSHAAREEMQASDARASRRVVLNAFLKSGLVVRCACWHAAGVDVR